MKGLGGSTSMQRISRELPQERKNGKSSIRAVQMFGKTDLAKYDLAYSQMPHIVSKGAQKCYAHFLERVVKLRKDDPEEKDFHNSVAKAILFKSTERIVSAQKFGGFRANIVAYTIAKLQNMNEGRISLEHIWKNQCISPALERAIEYVSHKANSLIQEERPDKIQNPSEWAKSEKAWKDFQDKEIKLPGPLVSPDLISKRAQGVRSPYG